MAQNAKYDSYYQPQIPYGDFEDNMSLIAFVAVDGEYEESESIEVGAYCGTQVRGYSFLLDKGFAHKTIFMQVYGISGEKISFKLYDHINGVEEDLVCLDELDWNGDGYVEGNVTIHFLTKTNYKFANTTPNGKWSTIGNWTVDGVAATALPNIASTCTIANNCTVDIDAEVMKISLSASKNITIANNHILTSPTFTIVGTANNNRVVLEDGAQLITNSNINKGTVKKDIAAYTSTRDNYYFISSPVGDILPTSVANLISTNEYDLYGFNGWYPEEEWINYEDAENAYWNDCYTDGKLLSKYGFLYANSQNTTLSFQGPFQNSSNPVSIDGLTYFVYDPSDPEADFPWACFNLLGNPFIRNAAVTGTGIAGYYIINTESNRSDVIACTNPVLAPCTGLMAVTTTDEATVTFTPSTVSATVRGNNHINIEVNNAEGNLIDRAYVSMNENNMVKFNLNSNATKLYFRENSKNYAIMAANGATQLPLFFETREYGTYTINVKLENMNCEYLHLIDNLTGMDIDLNTTPSYTFRANQGDYASRFKLVFEGTGVEENNANVNFAIVEGNRVVIPMIEHETTLDIIDMTGRTISSQKVNGSFDQTLNVKAGLYILNLNGMTQKIVIE